MKLAHISDLHLGYGGAGAGRARDVLRIFETALARIAEIGVELVVVSGDVFDHPDVTATPIAAFGRAVRTLRERLPGVVVAVAAGARDTPLDADRDGPLTVVGAMDAVEVASSAVRRLSLRDGEVSVTLVPHRALMGSRTVDLAPDPAATCNVLVVHAALAAGRSHAVRIRLDGWDYVALGSNHTYTTITERAHYAGSLERVGADPWAEAATAKGFITARLGTDKARSGRSPGSGREVTFWPVEARAAVSLAPVEATGGGTATVTRRLSEALGGVPGGIDGKLLRIPVRGLSADDLAVLDREVLARVRRRVAELRIDALPGQGTSHGRGGRGARRGRGESGAEVSGLVGSAPGAVPVAGRAPV